MSILLYVSGCLYVRARRFLQSYILADCQRIRSQYYYLFLHNEKQCIKSDCGLDVLLVSITQTNSKQIYAGLKVSNIPSITVISDVSEKLRGEHLMFV
jgi:hypothetical protein